MRSLLFVTALIFSASCTTHYTSVGDPMPTDDMESPLIPDAGSNFNAGVLTACASATQTAVRQPVYMLFVLDGSSSMNADNKWIAVVPALDAIFDQFLTLADPSFAVGFTIFADAHDHPNDPTNMIQDSTVGPYNMIDVPLAFVDATQHDKLRARVDNTAPYLGTPTYEVLSGQYPLLSVYAPALPVTPGGRPVMVFMTDGIPDTDMPAGTNERPYSLAIALQEAQLMSNAIDTFVVGIGELNPLDATEYDPTFVGQMAQNGGVAPTGCDPNELMDVTKMCHFQITPGGQTASALQQQFIDTINTIRSRALPCEYTLTQATVQGMSLDPSLVNVLYTPTAGTPNGIAENAQDGWTYDDPAAPSKVILHGTSCQMVRNDPTGKINIVVGCKTVIQ